MGCCQVTARHSRSLWDCYRVRSPNSLENTLFTRFSSVWSFYKPMVLASTLKLYFIKQDFNVRFLTGLILFVTPQNKKEVNVTMEEWIKVIVPLLGIASLWWKLTTTMATKAELNTVKTDLETNIAGAKADLKADVVEIKSRHGRHEGGPQS